MLHPARACGRPARPPRVALPQATLRELIGGLLGSGGGGRSGGAAAAAAQQQQRARCQRAADALLELLAGKGSSSSSRATATTTGGGGGGGGAPPRDVDALVDVLLADSEGLPFREELLGGGPWLVLFTRGAPQLWKATYQAGRLLNPDNTASQDLEPRTRAVVNRAQYFGDRLVVSASGTYEPLEDGGATLPARVRADIQRGELSLAGRALPLPIRGSGTFEVVWCDGQLRVFRSGGAVSVQVNGSYLARGGRGGAAGRRRAG